MATYYINELMRDIRVALDRNNNSTPLIESGDIDTLSLDDIIKNKITDAARVVHRDAPIHLLDGGVSFGESIHWFSREGIGGGCIVLPEDFLRLVAFQMSDWSYPITVAITEDNPLYALQSSRYAGVRGNPQKPVVVLSAQPIGLALEFYSCSAGQGVYVKRATYLPIPKIKVDDNDDEYIELCEKVKSAIVYYAAYLTALSIGEGDLAAVMLNTSKELMQ